MKNKTTGSKFEARPLARAGFTLIELLVVIAVIGILAGLILGVSGVIKNKQYINTATAELKRVEAALDEYKAQYGVYPPSNAQLPNNLPLTNTLLPQLYYELSGVFQTNEGGATYYYTLGHMGKISANDVMTVFGTGGFINCTKTGSDESAGARDFLVDLRANQIGSVTVNNVTYSNLITSARGPNPNYKPLGEVDNNPFRYVYPGVNNPNGYDLWVQLVIGNKTNLICNWSSAPEINNPLP